MQAYSSRNTHIRDAWLRGNYKGLGQVIPFRSSSKLGSFDWMKWIVSPVVGGVIGFATGGPTGALLGVAGALAKNVAMDLVTVAAQGTVIGDLLSGGATAGPTEASQTVDVFGRAASVVGSPVASTITLSVLNAVRAQLNLPSVTLVTVDTVSTTASSFADWFSKNFSNLNLRAAGIQGAKAIVGVARSLDGAVILPAVINAALDLAGYTMLASDEFVKAQTAELTEIQQNANDLKLMLTSMGADPETSVASSLLTASGMSKGVPEVQVSDIHARLRNATSPLTNGSMYAQLMPRIPVGTHAGWSQEPSGSMNRISILTGYRPDGQYPSTTAFIAAKTTNLEDVVAMVSQQMPWIPLVVPELIPDSTLNYRSVVVEIQSLRLLVPNSLWSRMCKTREPHMSVTLPCFVSYQSERSNTSSLPTVASSKGLALGFQGFVFESDVLQVDQTGLRVVKATPVRPIRLPLRTVGTASGIDADTDIDIAMGSSIFGNTMAGTWGTAIKFSPFIDWEDEVEDVTRPTAESIGLMTASVDSLVLNQTLMPAPLRLYQPRTVSGHRYNVQGMAFGRHVGEVLVNSLYPFNFAEPVPGVPCFMVQMFGVVYANLWGAADDCYNQWLALFDDSALNKIMNTLMTTSIDTSIMTMELVEFYKMIGSKTDLPTRAWGSTLPRLAFGADYWTNGGPLAKKSLIELLDPRSFGYVDGLFGCLSDAEVSLLVGKVQKMWSALVKYLETNYPAVASNSGFQGITG